MAEKGAGFPARGGTVMPRAEAELALSAPRVGAGMEVMSFAFPKTDGPRAQTLADLAARESPDAPRGVRIERKDRDIYIEWGASSHGIKPFFIY